MTVISLPPYPRMATQRALLAACAKSKRTDASPKHLPACSWDPLLASAYSPSRQTTPSPIFQPTQLTHANPLHACHPPATPSLAQLSMSWISSGAATV